MKAVLVGGIGSDKVYYIMDSGPEQKDGIVEKPNGKTIKIDFIDFTSSCNGLRKIRTSRFHRFLWDSPKNPTKGSWYETFVTKTRPVNDKTLDGAVVLSSLGQARKKINTKNSLAFDFIQTKSLEQTKSHSCCNEMVKFDTRDYAFETESQRKQAWEAIVLMKQLEGTFND